jgi:hypothetical protein
MENKGFSVIMYRKRSVCGLFKSTIATSFEASTAVMFQVEFFCVVTSCSVVVGYQRFRGPRCQGVTAQKTSTWYYPTIRLKGLRNTMCNSVTITDDPAEDRTKYLPNIREKFHPLNYSVRCFHLGNIVDVLTVSKH